jgi:hypothetical protein
MDKDTEELHFRLDEIERTLAAVPSTEHITGIAGGAVSVMLTEIKREIAEIRTEMLKDRAPREEDIALDRQVIESNRAAIDASTASIETSRQVCMCLKELVEQMRRPRELTAQLPSGLVTITSRQH